jgi:hypothetical protein
MKPHYPILEGLCDTVAIMVVTYHLFEAYYPMVRNHPAWLSGRRFVNCSPVSS